MVAFLPDLPGTDGLRALARRVDTARHRGVPAGCILELDLQAAPPETVGFDPLAFIGAGGRPLTLRQTIAAIHRATDDDRVAGLIARVQPGAAAAGPVQELREAIAAFGADKPTLAWAETYPGTLAYYLASAFGEVWMQPSGTVGLVGFATSAVFLRDALGKAGIEAQFVARGEYKSAANLFTEAGYTDAHREADTRLLDSLRGQVWEAVAASRRLTVESIDGLAGRAPLLREDAVAGGLIDRVGFRDEAYDRIAELVGADGVSPETGSADGRGGPPRLFLARYARAGAAVAGRGLPALPGRPTKPVVAVITVAGPIVSGRGGPSLSPLGRSSVGGDTVAAALREAAADDDVAAIVVRVDSPGGSVTGSETIWREVVRARRTGKPVVASMGAVAASGGYYVAMAADCIVANAGTITGSIGVVTGKLIARELKDKLGIGSEAVRTDANADAWSADAPFTADQQARVEAEADLFYADFVQRVADGRSLPRADVEAVARGRVWTGADARDRGLVDVLGGLRTAVGRALELAGHDADADARLVSLPGSSLTDLLRPKPSSVPAAASLPEALSELVERGVAVTLERAERSAQGGASARWWGRDRF